MPGQQAPQLLRESDVAERWNLSERCLQAWRLRGDGPPYLKLGRAVRYRLSDLDLWLENRRRTSTSSDTAHSTVTEETS